MIKTFGVFYDGISSSPSQIEIFLDEENLKIVFDTPSENITWHLKEIHVEQSGAAIQIRPSTGNHLQSLKITDPEFILNVKRIRKEKGFIGFYHVLLDMGVRSHALIALCILTTIGAAYFLVLPWIAERAVMFIPDSYDNRLGSTFFDQYVDYSSVDSSKSAAINKFAALLDMHNTKTIKITVVSSETVNAFALPDGNIIIYTGIIDVMKDYDELAGLLGHEVAHVNNRHSMKMMCRNLAGYFFLSAVLSDVNGIMAVIGDNIHTLQTLTYSRNFEHKADEEGLKVLIDNKIDPRGMSKLFSRLQTKYDKMVPEFLSSHPVTKERIKFIDKTIAKTPSAVIYNERLHTLFLKIKEN